MPYRKNVSQVFGFVMVTTAGAADAAASIAAQRIIDNGTLSSCTGNVINKGGGAYVLVSASADVNGNCVSLYFGAPGDVPLAFTFPTTANDPTNAASAGITNLDSTISSRMGTFTLPVNFASLGISSSGHVSNVDTLQIYTSNTPQSGDAFARIGVQGQGLSSIGDSRLGNLDSTISSRMGTFTIPPNFGVLGISAAGKVNGVVLVDTLTTYTGNTPQSGDSFARIGVNGAGLTAAASAILLDSANFTAAAENAFADALLDRTSAIETGMTLRLAVRYSSAALGGVLAGAATTTVTIQALNNAGTTRITATVDASGNRSAVVLA